MQIKPRSYNNRSFQEVIMVNFETAKKVIETIKEDEKVGSAFEFSDFYLFMMRPKNLPSGESYYVGTVFDAIKKDDGTCFQYDISEDPDAYVEAKQLI